METTIRVNPDNYDKYREGAKDLPNAAQMGPEALKAAKEAIHAQELKRTDKLPVDMSVVHKNPSKAIDDIRRQALGGS